MDVKSVGIQDLVVADFRSEHMDLDVAKWQTDNNIPYAESCARQVWFASRGQFETFPLSKIKGGSATLHYGDNAYGHLMRLNLGILSVRQGEVNFAGQFYTGWQRLRKENPEEAERYDRLMQHLTSDTRLIRGTIMNEWQMKTLELAARDLSGFNNKDRVLIVAHTNQDGSISLATDLMIRKLLSNEGKTASSITLTHPDPVILTSLMKDAKKLEQKYKFPLRIDSCVFDHETLAIHMGISDRVFVALPMDLYPDADKILIETWKKFRTEENTFTHLKAPAKRAGEIPKTWKTARRNLQNFIGPDDILNELARREQHNNAVLDKTESAIERCIELRLNGIQPSKTNLGKALILRP